MTHGDGRGAVDVGYAVRGAGPPEELAVRVLTAAAIVRRRRRAAAAGVVATVVPVVVAALLGVLHGGHGGHGGHVPSPATDLPPGGEVRPAPFRVAAPLLDGRPPTLIDTYDAPAASGREDGRRFVYAAYPKAMVPLYADVTVDTDPGLVPGLPRDPADGSYTVRGSVDLGDGLVGRTSTLVVTMAEEQITFDGVSWLWPVRRDGEVVSERVTLQWQDGAAGPVCPATLTMDGLVAAARTLVTAGTAPPITDATADPSGPFGPVRCPTAGG